MAPVLCLCKVLVPNRLYFGLLHFDTVMIGQPLMKYGGRGNAVSQCWNNVNRTSVRNQTTKVGARLPGPLNKHRTKKKALIDIIRVKEESVSEGKAKVTRLNRHSFDETLGIHSKESGSPNTTPRDSSSPFFESISSSHVFKTPENLGEEVSLDKFSKLLKSDFSNGLPSSHDSTREGLMHTYDGNFMRSPHLMSGEESNSTHFFDFDSSGQVKSREKFERLQACDLSILSSPLAGFADVNLDKLDAYDMENSGNVAKYIPCPPKPKKKVISSKKKLKSKVSSETRERDRADLNPEMEKKLQSKEAEVMNNISLDLPMGKVDDLAVATLKKSIIESTLKFKKKKAKLNKNIVQHKQLLENTEGAIAVSTLKSKKKKRKLSKIEIENEELRKKNALIRKLSREIIFNQTLEAYLSVCVNIGLVNLALNTLMYYCNVNMHNSESKKKITSIKCYNILFNALADKGSYKIMEELRTSAAKEGISMDVESYASFLKCLGRLPSFCGTPVQNLLEDMKKDGIKIDSLVTEVFYIQNDFDFVLKALRSVIPDFNPSDMKSADLYNCNLLKDLNSTSHSSKVRSQLGGLATEEELEKWTKEQLSQELQGELTIASIEKTEETSEVRYFREKLSRWESKWKKAMHSDFVMRVNALKPISSNKSRKEMNLYPYLVSIPPEDFIKILMQEVNKLAIGSEGFSASKHLIYRNIGEKVYQCYITHHKREVCVLKNLLAVYKKYRTWMLSQELEDGVSYIPRLHWNDLVKKVCKSPNLEYTVSEWPSNVLMSVGQFLFSIILRNVMVWKPLHSEKNAYPAFYEVDRTYDYRVCEEIKPAPVLVEVYSRAAKQTLTFPSILSPMVVPPIPWTSPKFGGYLVNSSYIIRLPQNAYRQRNLIDERGKEKMFPVIDSLNQLGCVPWRVNKPILDLMIEIFNNKGWEEMGIAPPVSECPTPPQIDSKMSSEEKRQIYRQQVEYNKKKKEMFSLRYDALYRLSFANHFRDRIIWFPHNMDFRGRVYPIPPHINHMSSDVFRSLLYFARGEKLGERGLHWLKLHLINLTGFKKRESLEERLKYFDEVIDDVYDSADFPLTGNKWWTKSDEPWQTLATCKELAGALRSGKPEEYVCHLPIHQDGSCNGLQHYAALGRDLAGAESVNLSPNQIPQDVYSVVTELVEKERLREASLGHEIAQMLSGFVLRKVIKQTVMTTVYGVTKYGARLQIERQLRELDFPSNKVFGASHYLVKTTFLSLEKMFTSAKEIQDWLTECARYISSNRRQNVEWVTPLGLPVVQHYTIGLNEKKMPMMKKGLMVNIDSVMQPSVMKQKNAFPPNFIHSLDSCHMMLTSLYVQRANITFVSIHDCFWTHASSVDVMYKICREQFVALHKEPILENLSLYLVDKFAYVYEDFEHDGSPQDTAKMKTNIFLRNVPKKGQFDISKVLESVYFFS